MYNQLLLSHPLRNIEEILAAKGEQFLSSVDSDETLQLFIEDQPKKK